MGEDDEGGGVKNAEYVTGKDTKIAVRGRKATIKWETETVGGEESQGN